jgi:hypothetical protein
VYQVLANAGCAESLPLFLDAICPPYVAVIVSVTAILFVGELLPQSLCTGPHKLKIVGFFAIMVYVTALQEVVLTQLPVSLGTPTLVPVCACCLEQSLLRDQICSLCAVVALMSPPTPRATVLQARPDVRLPPSVVAHQQDHGLVGGWSVLFDKTSGHIARRRMAYGTQIVRQSPLTFRVNPSPHVHPPVILCHWLCGPRNCTFPQGARWLVQRLRVTEFRGTCFLRDLASLQPLAHD